MATLKPENAKRVRRLASVTMDRVDHIAAAHGWSDRDLRLYMRLWTWSAARYSGRASDVQSAYAAHRGYYEYRERLRKYQDIIETAKAMVDDTANSTAN